MLRVLWLAHLSALTFRSERQTHAAAPVMGLTFPAVAAAKGQWTRRHVLWMAAAMPRGSRSVSISCCRSAVCRWNCCQNCSDLTPKPYRNGLSPLNRGARNKLLIIRPQRADQKSFRLLMRNVTASDPPARVRFADTGRRVGLLESHVLYSLSKYLLTVQLRTLLRVSPVVI